MLGLLANRNRVTPIVTPLAGALPNGEAIMTIQHQPSTTSTPAQRRESIEAIAAQLGIEPHQLTPEVCFTLGQVEYAKRIAISEGCGSGELPDRLRARVEEREAELRRLLDEQGQHDRRPARAAGGES